MTRTIISISQSFSWFFAGRPGGRRVWPSANSLAIRCVHGSLPNGWPRAIDSLTIFSSDSLCGKFQPSRWPGHRKRIRGGRIRGHSHIRNCSLVRVDRPESDPRPTLAIRQIFFIFFQKHVQNLHLLARDIEGARFFRLNRAPCKNRLPISSQAPRRPAEFAVARETALKGDLL
jgi:hypothetical protein